MSTQCVVVFGTASIQQYIFQSNRLKEIIGASYLAKCWFDKGLIASIQGTGCSFDMTAWDVHKDNPTISQSDVPAIADTDVNLIYIGGGNAALLCKSKDIAIKIIKAWSRDLLKNAPGIRVVVGYREVTESLQSAYCKALDKLKTCEEALPFGAIMGSLPVVRACSTTGLPAAVLSEEENNVNEWISQSAARKREEVGFTDRPGRAQTEIASEFESVLAEEQRFAIELDKLGGSEGQSHIAIVHADGNGMGEVLNKIIDEANQENDEFLYNLRVFSASVSKSSQSALEKTLLYFKNTLRTLEGLRQYKNIFPLRPIVYGGDDLTFVCDGRVGLDLAAYYLEEFAKKEISVLGTPKQVDACAGVVIVPSKFPFARAYRFADELCGLAKAHRRKHGNATGSWLDFQIIQEGITGSVSTLRNAQYHSLEGQKLYKRPYEVPTKWKIFVEILREFQSKQWPRSRAKHLLQVLTQGPIATKRFIEGTHWRGMILPNVVGVDANAKTSGWTGGSNPDRTTPYFDPLEALDFYLMGLLPSDEKEDKE